MKVKDPVCGMEIDEQQAAASSQHAGRTYYFCSEHCKSVFEKEPDAYASSAGHAH